MNEIPMRLPSWPIDRLIGYAYNPGKNVAAVERLCASISAFSLPVPCLVRGNGEQIDGVDRIRMAA